jgi:glutathione S-transferase
MLTLYIDDHWISPYAFSNFVGLREKKLEFTIHEVSLPKREHHAPEYRDRSLTGRVPVLAHDDFWLSESMAINEYLAEVFPFPKHPRIFPEDLKERAKARQLMEWVRSDLMPIREQRPTSKLFYDQPVQPLDAKGEAAVERLLRAADAVISEDRTTLFAQWCIADADFALMLNRVIKHGQKVHPKISRYADANWARPSVREWVDHQRKAYVEY